MQINCMLWVKQVEQTEGKLKKGRVYEREKIR